MKRSLLVTLAGLAILLGGCGTFYAEAEQPLLCLTLPPQTFTIPGGGIVAPPGGFTGSYGGAVDVGLSDVVPDFLLSGPSKDHVLHLLSFQATLSGSPGVNFDWLTDLRLTAQNGAMAPVQLGQYTRGAQTGVTTISLGLSAPGQNLADFLANGGLILDLSGGVSVPAGQTVPGTWSTTVTTCLYAKVHKTLQDLIGGK